MRFFEHHPSPLQLRDFLQGQLDAEPQQAIADHLANCPDCVRRLAQTPEDDPLVSLCRETYRQPTDETISSRLDDVGGPLKESVRFSSTPEDYEIEEEIGRGGMAIVYKARDLRLRRFVALKMVLAGPWAGRKELKRFRQEAETIARLRHPGVVQIYSVGEHEAMPYIALEFLEEGSLQDFMQGRPQPFRWSAELVRNLARTIHYAHARGIIHRDLKPSNILMETADGPSAKIADFGLAKVLGPDASGLSSEIVGTPNYMAPEQTTGQPQNTGVAVDIYALGMILYELLTGKPAFRTSDLVEIIRQIQQDTPPPPRRLRPQLPKDLETVCLKCLEKKPQQRYTSAAELADDLDRFLQKRPVRARPIGFVRRTLRYIARRPLRAVAAVAIILLTSSIVSSSIRDVIGRTRHRERIDRLLQQTPELREQALNRLNLSDADSLRRWNHWRNHVQHVRTLAENPWTAAEQTAAAQAFAAQAKQDELDQRAAARLTEARILAAMFNTQENRLQGELAIDVVTEVLAEYGVHPEQTAPEQMAELWRRWPLALQEASSVVLDQWRQIAAHSPSRQHNQAWLQAVLQQLPGDASRPLPYAADLPALQEAYERRPQDLWINLALGVRLQEGDPQQLSDAAGHLRAALAMQPRNAGVLVELGKVLQRQQHADEALRCFRKALEIQPDYDVAAINLGGAFADAGRHQEAKETLLEVLKRRPGSFLAHYQLGVVWASMKQPEKALAAFRRSAELQPNYGLCLFNQGVLHLRQKDYQAAAASFQRAVQGAPDLGPAHYNLGVLHFQQQDWEAARAALEQAIRCRFQRGAAYYYLGRIESREGEQRKARDAYLQALRHGGPQEELQRRLEMLED